MSSSLSRVARFALLLTLVAAAACSVDDPSFTGIIDAADPDGTQAIDADTTDGPPGTVNLTVTRDGTSTGTVTSNPGRINCGTQCSAAFAIDSMVTLTATPDPGAEFAGWAGGGCSGTSTCTVTLSAIGFGVGEVGTHGCGCRLQADHIDRAVPGGSINKDFFARFEKADVRTERDGGSVAD